MVSCNSWVNSDGNERLQLIGRQRKTRVLLEYDKGKVRIWTFVEVNLSFWG